MVSAFWRARHRSSLPDGGRVYLDGSTVRNPVNGAPGRSGQSDSALVYVRPHMLELEPAPSGGTSFAATVRHINAAGPRVKIELTSASGDPVLVEIEHDRLRALALQPGGQVYLRPREEQVFFYQT